MELWKGAFYFFIFFKCSTLGLDEHTMNGSKPLRWVSCMVGGTGWGHSVTHEEAQGVVGGLGFHCPAVGPCCFHRSLFGTWWPLWWGYLWEAGWAADGAWHISSCVFLWLTQSPIIGRHGRAKDKGLTIHRLCDCETFLNLCFFIWKCMNKSFNWEILKARPGGRVKRQRQENSNFEINLDGAMTSRLAWNT